MSDEATARSGVAEVEDLEILETQDAGMLEMQLSHASLLLAFGADFAA